MMFEELLEKYIESLSKYDQPGYGPHVVKEARAAVVARFEALERELIYREKVRDERLEAARLMLRQVEAQRDEVLKCLSERRALEPPPPLIVHTDYGDLRSDRDRLLEAAKDAVTDVGRFKRGNGTVQLSFETFKKLREAIGGRLDV